MFNAKFKMINFLLISIGLSFTQIAADEIKVAYTHFEATVVEPKRKKILSTFGYILKFFGLNVSLTVEPKSLVIEETIVNDTEKTNID